MSKMSTELKTVLNPSALAVVYQFSFFFFFGFQNNVKGSMNQLSIVDLEY